MSMTLFAAALGAALALGGPAASAPASALPAGVVTQATKSAKPAAAIASFVKTANEANDKEIMLATLAKQKSSDSDVKAMAQTIESDHKLLEQKAQTLAEQENVTLPVYQPSSTTSADRRLSKLTGASFDKTYANLMVSDHKTAISLFQKAETLGDPNVKAYAESALPVLQHHLELAEAVQKKLGGG